jgi:hypothetical protein
MANEKTIPGKTYSVETMIEVQKDFERARLGSSFKSQERTRAWADKINTEQQKRRENSK